MNERKPRRKSGFEVDFQTLLGAVMRKLWMVGIVSVLCAVLGFMGTHLFIGPEYQSYVTFYVNNSLSVGENLSIGASDISASKSLVESYIIILRTRQTLTDVMDYAGVEMDYKDIRSMVSAKSMSGTEVIRITVTCDDPELAYKLACAIEYVLPNRISQMIEGSSAKVVDSAMMSPTQTGPDYTLNATSAFLLGAIVSICAVALRSMLDTRVTSEEDIANDCKLPILTAVPNMNSATGGGYYYAQKKQSVTQRINGILGRSALFGPEISFAATEAYKLLRTKVLYSFAGSKCCRIIGVSSALAGEGKSLSTINLAYSLSQMGKRVLLIDCDLRRPSLATKLDITSEPGLSSYLTGQNSVNEIIFPCGIPNEENAFRVMVAGPNPPNPIELLSSERMKELLEQLRKEYDYVLLDFPPVGEVSDALSLAKNMDGVLLVVRQNYCDRNVLRHVITQFGYMQAKVLGIIYNCASEGNGLYRKYYYKYHYKYEGTYKADAKKTGKTRKALNWKVKKKEG